MNLVQYIHQQLKANWFDESENYIFTYLQHDITISVINISCRHDFMFLLIYIIIQTINAKMQFCKNFRI